MVGEVRCATTGAGSSWKLSGGSMWSSGVTKVSKKRQVRRAVSRKALRVGRRQRRLPATRGGRLAQRATAGEAATAAANGADSTSVPCPESQRDSQATTPMTERPGHAAIEAERSSRRPDRRLGRGDPFEQMPAADEQAQQRAHDRVAHQPGLMGQEHDDQRRQDRGPAEDRRRARAGGWRSVDPGAARRDGGDDRKQRRQRDRRRARRRSRRAPRQTAPPSRRAGPARRRAPRACAAGCPASSSGRSPACAAVAVRAGRLGPATEDPGQQLPVAARPAMVAQRADVVAGGKLLDDLDVRGEAGAGEHALEQVVAEQRRVRHAAGERGLEGVDVVDALAGVGALRRTGPDRRPKPRTRKGRCRSRWRRCAGTASLRGPTGSEGVTRGWRTRIALDDPAARSRRSAAG